MSAERQDTQVAAAALQARFDHLFRNHVRDDPNDAATTALRRLVEAHRLPQPGQPGAQS
jgi:hypothetical protein